MREKHGMTGTREYAVWKQAKQRAINPRNAFFASYGGRGIGMSELWQQSFSAFYAELGPCPEGMSLDRIDNDKGYETGNCRWATASQQVQNQGLMSRNKTGVKGVSFEARRGRYIATVYRAGVRVLLGSRKDFFEAVCLRKSYEARERGA